MLLIPVLGRQRRAGFEASLVYKVNCSTGKTTQRNLVPKKSKTKKILNESPIWYDELDSLQVICVKLTVLYR